jgi:hypothetical protein
MPLTLALIAVVCFVTGIMFHHRNLIALDKNVPEHLLEFKAESKRIYFIALSPLIFMALILLTDNGVLHSITYQIPAASLLVDFFCLWRIRSLNEKYSMSTKIFYFPFIFLAITKILLFAAFLMFLNNSNSENTSIL